MWAAGAARGRLSKVPTASEAVFGGLAPRSTGIGAVQELLPVAMQGTRLGSQGKGCTLAPEREEAERGPGDTKLPSHHVLGAPKEANDVSCWETTGPERGEGFEEYYSDTWGSKGDYERRITGV